MLKLALHGPRFSGKTTLAKALEARGFQVLNFTDLIKELFCAWADLLGLQITVEDIHANKEAYRQALIDFASAAGFDDGFGVELLLSQIKPDAQAVVFDNVRFPAQWTLLQDAGFTLLRITTPERVRVARAFGKGVNRATFWALAQEQTEQPLDIQRGEYRLSVNGDIERVIDDLTAEMMGRALWELWDDPILDTRIELLPPPAPKPTKPAKVERQPAKKSAAKRSK